MLEFSLKQFELAVHRREYEPAGRLLANLLMGFDQRYGAFGAVGMDERDERELMRLASAVTTLFCDRGFQPSPAAFQLIVVFQRWLQVIFGATPFYTADHILATYLEGEWLRAEDVHKFALLYGLDCEQKCDIEAMWKQMPSVTATMCLGALASRVIVTPQAHARREHLLEWLPSRIAGLDLDQIPVRMVHQAWMHSAYGLTPRRNDLKQALNAVVRRKMLERGFRDDATPDGKKNRRPRMVVVLDWFHTSHVVYRSFSQMIRALGERFEMHAVVPTGNIDDEAAKLFESVRSPNDKEPEPSIKDLAGHIRRLRPDIVFHIGVGMSQPGVFLANIRLAPVQVVSHGHPSSVRSDQIDYFLAEQSYAGAAQAHSEQMLLVPDDSFVSEPAQGPVAAERKDFGLDIVVMSTPMKLNPVFLGTCRKIIEGAALPIRLHVMVGMENGVSKRYVERVVQAQIPGANVYGQMDRESTLKLLASGDMFLTPFPFGNANSLVDCASQGMPGVSFEGIEIGERMAAQVTRRIGLPEALIAKSIPEYIETGIKLARDAEWRGALRRDLLARSSRGDFGICRGNPGPVVDAFLSTMETKEAFAHG